MENLPEGSPGRRCAGQQPTGEPFRIVHSLLPEGYDPHAFPEADVIACVWLDSRGVAHKAQLVGGTGNPALDRQLLRNLYRQWRFAPDYGSEASPGWQRIRLNSGHSRAPPPEPGYEPLPLLRISPGSGPAPWTAEGRR
jgi:hypothetical protein